MPKKSDKPADLDDILDVLNTFQNMVAERFDQQDRRFDEQDRRFDEIEKKLDHIYSILDSHMKRIEDVVQENAARDHQQARMERWIFQLADQMNVKLKYE